MKDGFGLNGFFGRMDGLAPVEGYQPPFANTPYAAKSLLTFTKGAMTRAQSALHAAIRQ